MDLPHTFSRVRRRSVAVQLQSGEVSFGGMEMNYFKRAECSVFASRSITAHILRGAIAAALLTWLWFQQSSNPVLVAAALVGAIIAMRGCPMCWTAGLFETIVTVASRRGNSGASGAGDADSRSPLDRGAVS
jgi:hypothetical protein